MSNMTATNVPPVPTTSTKTSLLPLLVIKFCDCDLSNFNNAVFLINFWITIRLIREMNLLNLAIGMT